MHIISYPNVKLLIRVPNRLMKKEVEIKGTAALRLNGLDASQASGADQSTSRHVSGHGS